MPALVDRLVVPMSGSLVGLGNADLVIYAARVAEEDFTIAMSRDQAFVLSDWLDRMIGTPEFDSLVNQDRAVWSPLYAIAGILDKSLVIGLARRPGSSVALREAGADAVVDNLDALARALSMYPPAGAQVARPGRVHLHGGIRVVPKTGGGWRYDGSAFTQLIADREVITIATLGESLVVTRRNVTMISGWRFGLRRGVQFETNDCDDRWIFRTMDPGRVLDCLRNLGWPVGA